MAGGDELIGLGGLGGGLAALALMGAGTNAYDAFSAVMSSPWSTEKFTGSDEDERMAREYVTHAMIISGAYAGIGAWLGRNDFNPLWPILGWLIAAIYMSWLYRRAVRRGRARNNPSPQATIS